MFRIKKFPKSLTEHTSVPYLFSPNFTYQFDFDYRARQFMIKEAANQHIYINVPKDLMSTIWNNIEGELSLQLICSRFKWESERVFRIVNQSNLDCLFEMCTSDKNDRDINLRYLKLLSVVKVDNLHENQLKMDSPHLLSDRLPLEDRDVLERLIRINQSYKTELSHALNTGMRNF